MGEQVDVDQLPYGLRLRMLRVANGWRQTDVADRAGVHQNLVSSLELRYAPPARGLPRQAAERVERVLAGVAAATGPD